MEKAWTKEGEEIKLNGVCHTRIAARYADHPHASFLDVLNRGAEAEQIEKAMLAMKAAIEGEIAYFARCGKSFAACPHSFGEDNFWHQALLDAAKLMPADEDDEKNKRIDAAEKHIKDAEDNLVAAKDELAAAKK